MDDLTRQTELRKVVVKANELITKSRFDLTLQQQKMVLFLISRIKPFSVDFELFEFKIRDFCRICGIDETSGKNYETLKANIKTIADKSIWVKLPNGKETLLRWIEKPYIDEKSGTIKIRLDNDMKPFLLELNKNFTRYELLYAMNFKSKYTIRLYEYVKAIHYYNEEEESYSFSISLEELKERMGAGKYTAFKDFHRRALKPAIEEINRFSDKEIEYDFIKKGKSVVSIKMNVRDHLLCEMEQIQKDIENSLNMEQLSLFD